VSATDVEMADVNAAELTVAVEKLRSEISDLKGAVGKHNLVVTLIGTGVLFIGGVGATAYFRADDRNANAGKELAVAQANLTNHEKLIDKLQKELTDLRQSDVAMNSPAIRTCGDFTTFGTVIKSGPEGFSLNNQGIVWDFAWKESTVIADQQGNKKSRHDVKPNTFVSVCFDNENGIHRVVKLNILPDKPQSIQPPLPMALPNTHCGTFFQALRSD